MDLLLLKLQLRLTVIFAIITISSLILSDSYIQTDL